MNILEDSINRCTGCCSCMNSCPVGAISMQENKHNTFLYPKINGDKCVKCKKCIESCPQNIFKNTNIIDVKPILLRADDDTRQKSSSGGAFLEFANYIINDCGIIYAPIFNDNFELSHARLTKKTDLCKAVGSKYLQSYIGESYKFAKKDLLSGALVLFVGTPCQIAGLKKYLAQEYTNLITIDILCHGVPSNKMFIKYLHDLNSEKKPKTVNFRDKTIGWRCDTIVVQYDNYTYKKSRFDGDPYELGFHNNLTLRNSCENCKFCNFPRVGDISMGDFWGLSKIIDDNDTKGSSIVFINNKKGKVLFDLIDKTSLFYKEINIDSKKLPNRVSSLCEHNRNKEKFYSLLENNTFSDSVRFALNGYEFNNLNVLYCDKFNNFILSSENLNISNLNVLFRGSNCKVIIGSNCSINADYFFIENNSEICIGDNVTISKGTRIELRGKLEDGGSSLIIGSRTNIGPNNTFRLFNSSPCSKISLGMDITTGVNNDFHVNTGAKIIIGNDCMFAKNVCLFSSDGHAIYNVKSKKRLNDHSFDERNNDIIIHDHVWLGIDCLVLKSVEIGEGSILGARTVVSNKKYFNNVVIIGSPSRVLKKNIFWSRKNNNLTTFYSDYFNETHESLGDFIIDKTICLYIRNVDLLFSLTKKLLSLGNKIVVLFKGDTFRHPFGPLIECHNIKDLKNNFNYEYYVFGSFNDMNEISTKMNATLIKKIIYIDEGKLNEKTFDIVYGDFKTNNFGNVVKLNCPLILPNKFILKTIISNFDSAIKSKNVIFITSMLIFSKYISEILNTNYCGNVFLYTKNAIKFLNSSNTGGSNILDRFNFVSLKIKGNKCCYIPKFPVYDLNYWANEYIIEFKKTITV